MKPWFFHFLVVMLCLPGCAVGSGGAKSGAYEPMKPVEGSSWELVFQRETAEPVRIAAFLDGRFGVTGGPSEAGKARFTADGGLSWSPSDGSADCLFGLDVVDARIAWQCSSGPVRVSTDGARTWTAVGDFGNFCRQLSFLDAATGWIADKERLGATRDGGRTWGRVELPRGLGHIAAVGLRTPREGYLLDIGGAFFVTVDGGSTWTPRNLPLDPAGSDLPDHDTASAAVRFTDAEHGTVVVHVVESNSSRLIVFRTADAGRTWSRKTVMDVPLLVSVYLSHDARMLTVVDKAESNFVVLRDAEAE
jgi:hypothetical protein